MPMYQRCTLVILLNLLRHYLILDQQIPGFLTIMFNCQMELQKKEALFQNNQNPLLIHLRKQKYSLAQVI